MKSVFALSLLVASFGFAHDSCCQTEEEALAKKLKQEQIAEGEIAQEEVEAAAAQE